MESVKQVTIFNRTKSIKLVPVHKRANDTERYCDKQMHIIFNLFNK